VQIARNPVANLYLLYSFASNLYAGFPCVRTCCNGYWLLSKIFVRSITCCCIISCLAQIRGFCTLSQNNFCTYFHQKLLANLATKHFPLQTSKLYSFRNLERYLVNPVKACLKCKLKVLVQISFMQCATCWT